MKSPQSMKNFNYFTAVYTPVSYWSRWADIRPKVARSEQVDDQNQINKNKIESFHAPKVPEILCVVTIYES